MSKTGIFRDVVAKLMEGTTIDENNKLQVIDESVMAEADELLDGLLKETARDWWMQLESAENSLASMQDDISFSEMNADPSHVVASPLALDADPVDVPTMESMLGESEFNLDSIFNEDDDDGPADGDEQYDDMITGNDKLGMGDDSPIDTDGEGYEDDMDSMGGEDEFGSDDGEFDFSWLDDPMGDELGGEDEFGDGMEDPMGDELGGEDEFGEDEFGDGMEDPMEGFMESDDDDDDDDDKKCNDEDDE